MTSLANALDRVAQPAERLFNAGTTAVERYGYGQSTHGWKISMIGQFNPEMEAPNGEACTDQGGHTVYKDVELFLDAVTDHCDTPAKRDIIRRDLKTLLRGTAQQWYIAQLQEEDREWLKQSVDNWMMALRRYFGLPVSEAEKLLISCTFNETNIQQNKSIRTYAMDKMRFAKPFGSIQTLQLLTQSTKTWSFSSMP
jgi:hypothetical protein